MFKKYNRFSRAFPRSVTKRTLGVFYLIWSLLLLFIILAALNTGIISNKELENDTTKDLPDMTPSILGDVRKTQLVSRNDITGNRHYDILISSYMRSGSSYTGQLLAFQPDTFYWYEPMLSYHGLYYLLGRYVCIGHNTCGDFGNDKIKEIYDLLDNLYSCNFRPIETAVAENATPNYSGANWKPYLNCRDKNQTVSSCLTIMEDVCRRSKHRATKIVRLTVDNLEYVLEHRPNLKAIHLIRDPRAIINSRITTKWYNLNVSEQTIKSDAHELCSRIKYDLIQGEKLKQKYPQRFSFVMYEDLQTDLKTKTEMLYSYFGIGKSDVKSKTENSTGVLQEEHKVNRTHGSYTNWWRFQLSFRTLNVVDSVCGNVLAFLGYRIFLNESELRNVSNKAFNFRKELLISNLNESGFYDFKALRNQRPYRRTIDIIPKQGNEITEHKTLLI